MNNSKTLLTAFALTATMGLAAAIAPPAIDSAQEPADIKQQDDVVAKVGEKAPDFTLMDTEGEEVSLSDFEDQIVVLQWINPQCPVCKRVMEDGLVMEMHEELLELDEDLIHLTINSTHYHTPEHTAEYLKEHDMEDVPGLDDSDGVVGKLYEARTTPHLYVIDKEGILRYNGAFDDDQRGTKDNRTNYVVNAVKQIIAGETVAPAETKPYGCSVKYEVAEN